MLLYNLNVSLLKPKPVLRQAFGLAGLSLRSIYMYISVAARLLETLIMYLLILSVNH